MARRMELPGVVVEQVPTRYYPSATLASHSFGHVGEVTDRQLQVTEDDRLRSGSIVGQSGLEQEYNDLLMGHDGARHVVVNSIGREVEMISEVPPGAGRQLQVTLDYDLQRAAEEAFQREGYAGAAVALDPATGDVLALVSLPAFDPNDFAVGIDRETWSSLNTDPLRPLQNRALQGRYPPGSTFKIVMAAAALEERCDRSRFQGDLFAAGARSSGVSIGVTRHTGQSPWTWRWRNRATPSSTPSGTCSMWM